jgi:hypothetical protein
MLSITLRDDELGGYMLPHAEVHNCSLHTYTQTHTQKERTGVKREDSGRYGTRWRGREGAREGIRRTHTDTHTDTDTQTQTQTQT